MWYKTLVNNAEAKVQLKNDANTVTYPTKQYGCK